MNLYIQRNLLINQIFHQFTTEKEVWPYSIDESILDMTHTWRLFGNSVREVARLIQKTVRQKLGLYTTVGIGDNPVQAKLALDLYAKHNHELIGEIHYETVPDKIWSITELTAVWGIGPRMAKRLNRLHIHNMYELAHTNPYYSNNNLASLVANYLLRPGELIAHKSRNQLRLKKLAWVIRKYCHEIILTKSKLKPSLKKLGNRWRRGFHQALKMEPTNDNQVLTQQLLWLFRQNWDGQAVRNIGVYSSKLSANSGQQLNLFETPRNQIRRSRLNQVIDEIHRQFGFTKLVYATSLLRKFVKWC